jgi:hypothetical protein
MSVTTIGKWCQGNEEGDVHEGLKIRLPALIGVSSCCAWHKEKFPVKVGIPVVSFDQRFSKPGKELDIRLYAHCFKRPYNLFHGNRASLHLHNLLYIRMLTVLPNHTITKKDGLVKTGGRCHLFSGEHFNPFKELWDIPGPTQPGLA